jgi:acetyl/propionyl-CoA carboxylase alpha subunit
MIRYLDLPQGPGVRNDNGVYAGYTVPVYYDPMLSKLIAHGHTREQAVARMRRALSEYKVEGIETTIPFFAFIMDHPAFQAGEFDTGFIDRIVRDADLAGRPARREELHAALAAAAVIAFEDSQRVKLPEESDSRWRHAGRVGGLRGRP